MDGLKFPMGVPPILFCLPTNSQTPNADRVKSESFKTSKLPNLLVKHLNPQNTSIWQQNLYVVNGQVR